MNALQRAVAGCDLRVWCLFALCAALLAGCGEDEPAVERSDSGAQTDAGPPADAAVIDPVPEDPHRLLLRLPQPPSPAVLKPGDDANGLAVIKALKASPYSEAIQIHQPTSGAFRSVLYQLSADRSTVNAVLMTFKPAYNLEARRQALHDAMTVRLGKSQRITTTTHSGHGWDTFDYRIELREARRSGDLELLFHHRPMAER